MTEARNRATPRPKPRVVPTHSDTKPKRAQHASYKKLAGATAGLPRHQTQRAEPMDPIHRSRATFLLTSNSSLSAGPEGLGGVTAIHTRTPRSINALPSPISGESLESIPAVDLTIAIVGARGAGKSTFCRLASPTDTDNGRSGATMFVVDGQRCRVIFREMDLESVVVGEDETVHWTHESNALPKPDGVAILYSVMDPGSLKGVPALLRALADSRICVILVATNCDNPPMARLVNPDAIATKAKEIAPDLTAYKNALYAESRPRMLVEALLAKIGGRRAPSAHMRHGSAVDTKGGSNEPATALAETVALHDLRPGARLELSSISSDHSDQKGQYARTIACEAHTDARDSLRSPSDLKIKTMISGLTSMRSQSPSTFLDLNDSSEDEADDEDTIPGIESSSSFTPKSGASQAAQLQTGVTFDELVERLLQPVPSKEEAVFQYAFLSFYRLFAAPSRLLDAIISRFVMVTRNPVTPWVHDTQLASNFAALELWISNFPGDLAKLSTRNKLQSFLENLVKKHGWIESDSENRTEATANWDWTGLTAAAQQMSLALESIVEDDDTDWAFADPGTAANRSRANTFLSISSNESSDESLEMHSSRSPRAARSAISHLEHDTKLIFGGQSTVTLAAIGASRVNSALSIGSSITLVSIAESAGRQAALLTLNPSHPLDKGLWRLFMSYTEEQIACELTRIDWIQFSAIRPRDLVRNIAAHASAASLSNHAHPAAESVARMIEHFNHLAFWVTNLILLRDKAKHRAQMLEKLMKVARELRILNNYNALGAFVAAIRGPAISRLSATRTLVDADVQKKFASLEILMSTARGHWAYRFALENTEQEKLPCVPFFPLHRRDLILAYSYSSSAGPSASSSTLDAASLQYAPAISKINWAKFAVMGETLAVLHRAQKTPFAGFSTNDEIRNLLLRCIICKDEDELYERSVSFETAVTVDSGQRAQQVRRKLQDRFDKLRLKGQVPVKWSGELRDTCMYGRIL